MKNVCIVKYFILLLAFGTEEGFIYGSMKVLDCQLFLGRKDWTEYHIVLENEMGRRIYLDAVQEEGERWRKLLKSTRRGKSLTVRLHTLWNNLLVVWKRYSWIPLLLRAWALDIYWAHVKFPHFRHDHQNISESSSIVRHGVFSSWEHDWYG